jgi:hypothetical protein
MALISQLRVPLARPWLSKKLIVAGNVAADGRLKIP